MKYFKRERERRRSAMEVKERIARDSVKKRLKAYKNDLDYIDIKKDKIRNLRSSIDGIKASMSSTEVVQGGSTSQEDKIIKVLDKISNIEKEIQEINEENSDIRYALNSIKEPSHKSIVYHVWINNDMSMEQMGRKLHLSTTAIWKRSDKTLKYINKILNQYNM